MIRADDRLFHWAPQSQLELHNDTVNGSMRVTPNGVRFTSTSNRVEFSGSFFSGLTSVTISIKFTPLFAYDDNTTHHLIDADSQKRIMIWKGSDNILMVLLGTTTVGYVASGDYSEHWKQNEENVITATITDGDQDLFLNGQHIGSMSSAWTSSIAPTTFKIGSSYYNSDGFGNGFIKSVDIWPRKFTKQEVDQSYNDKLVVVPEPVFYAPMRMLTTVGSKTSTPVRQAGYNIEKSGGVTVARGAGVNGRDCLEFDGSSGTLIDNSSPPAVDFEYNEPFSLGCLAKPRSANIMGLVGKFNESTEKGIRFFIGSDRGLYCDMIYSKWDEAFEVYSGAIKLSLYRWYALMVTYDGSNTAEGFNLYIEGDNVTNTSVNAPISSGSIKDGNFAIGSNNNQSRWMDGHESDPTVWNVKLSQSQAKEWTRQIRGMV